MTTRVHTPPLLEIRGGSKRFGPVTALTNVNLTLEDGEVLALLGDNGAGKSTLIKSLSGVHELDDGEILVRGEPVRIRTPSEARALGIETVYQDLSLFDNLTATENFFAGRELTSPRWLGPLGFTRRRAMTARTSAALERLKIAIKDPGAEVGLMSGGQRQAVAVARAQEFASLIVILDEPTAALGVTATRSVSDLIRRLPQHGVSVILISHNLEEVSNVADRAIVLRQGRTVGEARPTRDNHERFVSWMVGSDVTRESEPPSASQGAARN